MIESGRAMKGKTILLATGCVLALSACDPARTHGEAGAHIDTGAFGNATMQNLLVQSGQTPYVIDLAHKFADEVPTTVHFAFDSARLDGAAQATLRRQAQWMRQFPEARFRVFGHTDAVGTAAYNQRLGQRRANAVVGYLVSQGVSRSRLEGVVSLGESQPLIVTEGREPRNRRTVTEVSGFVERHPTVMSGNYAAIIHREYVASAVPPHQGTEISLGSGG